MAEAGPPGAGNGGGESLAKRLMIGFRPDPSWRNPVSTPPRVPLLTFGQARRSEKATRDTKCVTRCRCWVPPGQFTFICSAAPALGASVSYFPYAPWKPTCSGTHCGQLARGFRKASLPFPHTPTPLPFASMLHMPRPPSPRLPPGPALCLPAEGVPCAGLAGEIFRRV